MGIEALCLYFNHGANDSCLNKRFLRFAFWAGIEQE